MRSSGLRLRGLAAATVCCGFLNASAFAQASGDCFVVHGRLQVGNGAPSARIWLIGTDRILGIPDGPAGDELRSLPPNVRELLGDAPSEKRVFGEFSVCPLTEDRPGWMRMVTLKDVTVTAVERLGG